MRQLSRRVGNLPDGVRVQIDQLSLEALEALGEALLDFAELADLQGWLQAYGQRGEREEGDRAASIISSNLRSHS